MNRIKKIGAVIAATLLLGTTGAVAAGVGDFVAPTTGTSNSALDKRLDAVEAWIEQNDVDAVTPTETATPTPTPTQTVTPTPTPTPTDTSVPTNEVRKQAYTTGYGWWDNTPAGSSDISDPVIHNKAAGTGTYADPVTIAVGHSIINGKDILDYPKGTIMYIPNLQKYFIVEDTCGDGNNPQNGPCHVGYPAGTTTWVDVWIGGQSATHTQSNNCESKLTDANGEAHLLIINPASNYKVVSGDILLNGVCRANYGNTPVTQ